MRGRFRRPPPKGPPPRFPGKPHRPVENDPTVAGSASPSSAESWPVMPASVTQVMAGWRAHRHSQAPIQLADRSRRALAPLMFMRHVSIRLLTPNRNIAASGLSALLAIDHAASFVINRLPASQSASSSMSPSQCLQPRTSSAGPGGCIRRAWATSWLAELFCRPMSCESFTQICRREPACTVRALTASRSVVRSRSMRGSSAMAELNIRTGIIKCLASREGASGEAGPSPNSLRICTARRLASALKP